MYKVVRVVTEGNKVKYVSPIIRGSRQLEFSPTEVNYFPGNWTTCFVYFTDATEFLYAIREIFPNDTFQIWALNRCCVSPADEFFYVDNLFDNPVLEICCVDMFKRYDTLSVD